MTMKFYSSYPQLKALYIKLILNKTPLSLIKSVLSRGLVYGLVVKDKIALFTVPY